MEKKDLIKEAYVNPEVFEFNKEEEEKVLKEAGSTDIMNDWVCENCKHYKEGFCQVNNKKVNVKEHCGFFDESFEEEEGALKLVYDDIIELLKKYCDLREEYYPVVALWIIGTYMYKNFPAYPRLYFNAMKGSGKTRILNLISHLAWNGKMVLSLSEAVLFRTASQSTFCIDECEGIGGREKQNLRELLNAGYKNGTGVERAKKTKTIEGESYNIERYDVYCPVALANIWGMEEVLFDRCISCVLERSGNTTITKKIEDFDDNDAILRIRKNLVAFSSIKKYKNNKLKNYKNMYKEWNQYVHNTTNPTNLINNISLTNPTTILFDKINKTELNSRNLELFLPLFLIANLVSPAVLDDLIIISKKMVEEKKESDLEESRDVNLIEFVSKYDGDGNFVSLGDILKEFKAQYTEEDEDVKWINSRWLGRALKRLNLIGKRRRINGRRQIILNVEKAKKQIQIFKIIEPEEEKQPEEEKIEVKTEKVDSSKVLDFTK